MVQQRVMESNILTTDVPVEIKDEKQCECESHLGQGSCKKERINYPFVPGREEREEKLSYLSRSLVVQTHRDYFLKQLIVGDSRMSR
jgi:hypothetical protein